MAQSKARVNTLARIRRRQSKLNPSEQIKIDRGVSTFELKRIEKTLNAKIQLSQAGVDTSAISVLSPKTAIKLEAVGRSLKAKSPVTLASNINKLARENKELLKDTKKQLSGLEGFGNIDFVNFALEGKVKPSSKLLEQDTKFLINAITDQNFVPDTIKELTKQVNGSLRLQGLDPVTFDEFDLEDTIQKLNAVDQRTKNIARYVEFDEDIVDEIF